MSEVYQTLNQKGGGCVRLYAQQRGAPLVCMSLCWSVAVVVRACGECERVCVRAGVSARVGEVWVSCFHARALTRNLHPLASVSVRLNVSLLAMEMYT